MYSGGADTRAKSVQAVVVTVQSGCGGDAYGGLIGRTDGWGGGDGRDGDGDRLSQWEDNVANVTLRTEPNVPLAYAPRLGHHQPIMSTVGDTRGQL